MTVNKKNVERENFIKLIKEYRKNLGYLSIKDLKRNFDTKTEDRFLKQQIQIVIIN